MPFISVFEQEILDLKLLLQAKDQQMLQAQAELLQTKEQLLQVRDQQIRYNFLQGIALCLKLKFQTAGQTLFAEVQKQTDTEWLRGFLASIDSAATVEELRRLLP